MGLKENVNKIHSDLSQKYNVLIEECSNKEIGNFVQFSIIEGSKNLIAIVTKKDLEQSNFNWIYKSNPLNESSDFIERNSNISEFTAHVTDIFDKNRFDSEYLKNLD